MQKILHLGCGRKKRKGAIGVDIVKIKGVVDVVHDISRGLPFKDSSFDVIVAEHVLEHLEVKAFNFVLEEIYRVGKKNAVVEIVVPHYSGRTAWIDPTHVRGFSINTFDFYYSEHPVFDFYSKAKYRVLSKKVTKNTIGTRNVLLDTVYNKMFIPSVTYLANKQTSFFENLWCYWVGGFDLCIFRLSCLK